MITFITIAAPSALVALVLEVRDGRADAYAAGLDGGILIGIAAIGLHMAGVI